MKNKNLLIVGAIVLVILLAGGGYYLYSRNKASQKQAEQNQQDQEQTTIIPTLTPDDIGLVITIRDDKNAMKFDITNASDITHVDYAVAYTAQVQDQQVSQGLTGEIANDNGDGKIGVIYREFGTCSKGVCRYDTVVSPIKLTLKITKKDGKVYDVEKTIDKNS